MRDPLGFVDGPNVYAYVAGNPVGFNDTLGLSQRVPCRTPKSKYPRGDDSVADPKRSPDDDYDYPHIPKDVYKELDKTLNRGGQPSWPHMPKSDGSPNPWKWHRRGPNYEDILKDDRNNKAHDPHFDYIRHYDNDKHNTKKWRVYPGENGLECEAVPV